MGVMKYPKQKTVAQAANLFKCGCCGKTLPVENRELGLPPAWPFCKGCWAENQRLDPFKNPLGPTTRKDEVKR